MFLASDPQIRSMIAAGTPVAIGVSGGKDSQAVALSVFEHLDRVGHAGSRILVHADLGTVATRQGETHPLFRRLVSLESRSGFAFQGARWLGDVAPQLLTRAEWEQLADAKFRAAKRIEVESTITGDRLYVRGWPTRVLTDREADTLASVRRVVTDLYGFRSSCLDRRSIQARYRELLSLRQSKVARSRP